MNEQNPAYKFEVGPEFELPVDYYKSKRISKSDLDLINICPLKFWKAKNGFIPEVESEDFIFGKLFHLFILEPEIFEQKYYFVKEKFDLRKSEDKIKFAEIMKLNEGKEPLKLELYDKLHFMRDSIFENKINIDLLMGEKEKEIYWTEVETGVECRSKLDVLGNGFITDLKTTRSASDFSKSSADYRYHVQAAFYRQAVRSGLGISNDDFLFVCVEKAPPYLTAVYTLNKKAIARGRNEYIENLKTYKECKQKDYWPGLTPDGITEIDLPSWYYFKK